MEAAIRLIQVTKSFGSHQAIAGIGLTVYPGEMVGIVGPDGAGKTTLVRLAAGVLAPTGGRVEPESRGRVGYLSGRFSLYPELTVWENLLFFARIYGMKARAAQAEATRLLEWVGLLPFRQRLAGDLSGGMRQKLALACAVIHRPPILLLDEPTTAVDPVARADFWALLRQQAEQGCAVLVTTPYMDEAEHCHRVALLHKGRFLATGSARELKARLPYRMALLTPAPGTATGQGMALAQGKAPSRREVLAVAAGLPGRHWVQPLGTGVRVALAPEAPLAAPPGYLLTEVPASLEDTFVWLSTGGQEVQAG